MTKVLRVILPPLVLAAGVAAMMYLVHTRPKAERKPPEQQATMVEVAAVVPERHATSVSAMGTVQPAETVVVMPEVTGRVTELHPNFLPGGRLKAGEVLARIDPKEFELAVVQQRATVARARFELKQERGRRTVAEREWKLLEEGVRTTRAGRDLALRRPQLVNARASLAGAEAGLEMAQLRVERTTIYTPFDSLVREKKVDLGQLVGPQSQVATLVGTHHFWVQVAVPVTELPWITLPGPDGTGGASARVIQTGGGGVAWERNGRVIRLLGDVDPLGRMARVLVQVDDPLATGDAFPPLPLFLGSYVRVKIEGKALDEVYAVPRTALHDGDRVWLADAEDRLAIREVEVARRASDHVYVRAGLQPGDRVVVSGIAAPVPGMALAVAGETAAPPPTGERGAPPAAAAREAKATAAVSGLGSGEAESSSAAGTATP